MVSIIDILVNKQHPLDKNYYPEDLVITDNNENNFHRFIDPTLKPCVRQVVFEYFKLLQQNAFQDGFNIVIDSGFRSYDYQQVVWDNCLKENGLEHTEKFVAPPGASEHQTGLAVDIAVFINNQYDDNITKEYKEYEWMLNNSYKYGFILRYPEGKEKITGYGFEPWHFRYVGIPISTIIHNDDITLEEYHQSKKLTLLK